MVSKQAWPDSVASQKAEQIIPEQYDFDVPTASEVHQMGSYLLEPLYADPELSLCQTSYICHLKQNE